MTPCVGICSTSIAGSVCRGCKRYAHEVIRWNSYSNQEREIIWKRLEQFRVTLVGKWIAVVDAGQLRTHLSAQKIKFNPALDPLAWVYDLLRAGASQLGELENYGLQRLPAAAGKTPVEIYSIIEQEYLTLSEAHYARYFADVPPT